MRKRIAPLLALGAGLALVGGCSFSAGGVKSVSSEELSTQISAKLQELKPDLPTPKVECPESLAAEKGSTVTCVVSVEGDSATYDVAVTSTGLNDDASKVGFDFKVADAPN